MALSAADQELVSDLARKEVASLCGLVLKRVGDKLNERGLRATSIEPLEEIASVFAEALPQFSVEDAGDEIDRAAADD